MPTAVVVIALMAFAWVWLAGVPTLPADNHVKWKVEYAETPNPPLVAEDGTVYVACRDGKLYALGSFGISIWSYGLGGTPYSSPSIGPDGWIYQTASGILLAVDPDNPRPRSSIVDVSSMSSFTPAWGLNGEAYMGNSEHEMLAVGNDGALMWRFRTGDYLNSAYVVDSSGRIVFSSQDGNVYALTPDGSLDWVFRTRGLESGVALGADDTAVFGTTGGYLHALNADGTLAWKIELGGNVNTPVVAPDGTIYVSINPTPVDDKCALCAVGPGSEVLWELPLKNKVYKHPVVGSDSVLYFTCDNPGTVDKLKGITPYRLPEDGQLVAVSTKGRMLWRMNFTERIASIPALGPDGTIYVATQAGNLYAITPP